MEKFFYIGCQVDEVKLIDLLLRRYHTLEFTKVIGVESFLRLVLVAIEGDIRDKHREEYLALLPKMVEVGKYMTFDDYFDKATGRNIDLRPTEEILAEIDAAHQRVHKEE